QSATSAKRRPHRFHCTPEGARQRGSGVLIVLRTPHILSMMQEKPTCLTQYGLPTPLLRGSAQKPPRFHFEPRQAAWLANYHFRSKMESILKRLGDAPSQRRSTSAGKGRFYFKLERRHRALCRDRATKLGDFGNPAQQLFQRRRMQVVAPDDDH